MEPKNSNTNMVRKSSKEFDTMHGLNQYDFHARQYDPAIGRFTTPDPLAEKHYNWSPYAYCLNNPMRFNDPTGMTEEERLAAVNQIRSLIGNSYSKMDCSETVDKAIRESTDLGSFKTGTGVDREDGNGKWANGVALIVSNSRETSTENMQAGNTVTFRSGRSDHKGEDGKFDHIGMVTNITKDNDGNVSSFDFVHSSSKGVNEATYNMTSGLRGFELKGVQVWDTPVAPLPEATVTATLQRGTPLLNTPSVIIPNLSEIIRK